jgi:hypothetical protein
MKYRKPLKNRRRRKKKKKEEQNSKNTEKLETGKLFHATLQV